MILADDGSGREAFVVIDDVAMRAVGSALREVAAAAILPRFRALLPSDLTEKEGPHDLVTAADLESERMLAERLGQIDPGALVVGEEAAETDPGLVAQLGRPGRAWIIDPVDGTLNFACGLPLFGVILAYVVDGVTEAGWLYDPLRDRLVTARRGRGTWIDGRQQHIAVPRSLLAMHGILNSRNGDRRLVARMTYRANRIGSMMVLRCCAQEYMAMLDGAISFAVYHRTKPWDHAAGLLIHAEAGGFAARIDGESYRLDWPVRPAPLLVAPDRASWEQIRETLFAEEPDTP